MFINRSCSKPFDSHIWLSSPTMHGEELQYMKQAFDTNWMSTVGENINVCEEEIAKRTGVKHAAALSSGTAALHMAVKLAGIGQGDKVACSDMTFAATVNPIVYEGGVPVFIDSEPDTWNMDPKALEKAFELYPDIKAIMIAHLYGTPAKMDEIRAVAQKYNVPIIEDAAESFGASYKGIPTGSLGDIGCISTNGNKIITGSTGGFLLSQDKAKADKVRKWSTQARENAPWYQHEELGYNYRMSNVVAGVVRGQLNHLQEHIDQKKAIYERYKEGLRDLPVSMNPFDAENSVPNYWLSAMTIDPSAMAKQVRSDQDALYAKEPGKSSPTEILETIAAFNAEGRPIWKPMHMQPIYRNHPFVTRNGQGRASSNAYIAKEDTADGLPDDISMDIFERGLCLPSDNKMTPQEQDRIIALIHDCFA